MPNEQYMHQSAMLYSSYYHLQVTVHRSFIPIPSKPASNGNMSLPSLTICTNAARACIHTLEAQFKRSVLGGYQNLVCNIPFYTPPGLTLLENRLRFSIPGSYWCSIFGQLNMQVLRRSRRGISRTSSKSYVCLKHSSLGNFSPYSTIVSSR